jgi:DNA-binding MarR family transcriptional regulator
MTNEALRTMLDVDRLIHEPARLVIVSILSVVESADFLYLLRETGLTKGNLSSHLSKLEQGAYVEIEKTYRGKTPLTICRLTDKGRSALDNYRSQLSQVMAKLDLEG